MYCVKTSNPQPSLFYGGVERKSTANIERRLTKNKVENEVKIKEIKKEKKIPDEEAFQSVFVHL